MRIAVDAMGGDFAPREVVRGALQVSAQIDFTDEIVLVGNETAIRSELELSGMTTPSSISIVHASESIDMHEHPAQAMKRKRNSSLVICAKLVKSGEVDGTFSAGNTGAAMAIALYDIGRISGIDRPAIATILPTLKGPALLLDAGAMMDCSPQNLLQFALLGSIYADKVMHLPNPSIGLLNVGSEAGKGNELTKNAYQLLSDSKLNFYGNVEGKDVYEHTTDVVVCDGFVGNVLLKSSEGICELIVDILRRELLSVGPDSSVGANQHVARVLSKFDYAETGGAPLLGIDGVTFIGHGRSKDRAVVSAIKATLAAAASGYIAEVRNSVAQ
jgi:glycerol-3-phosphate acyltransferase PlsX